MTDLLSIFGIVISIVSIVIALLLFNASINNSRKIILNKVLRYIIFDGKILMFFSDSTEEKEKSITVSQIKQFEQSVIKLSHMLQDISFEYENGLPLVGQSNNNNDNVEYTHIFHISDTYNLMNEAFKSKKLPNFNLMLNEYDDRCSFLQNYARKERYVRKALIGPIIGIRYIYYRKRKYHEFDGVKVKLVKKIKSLDDYYKYYDKCYSKFNYSETVLKLIHRQDKVRKIKDLTIITDEKNQIPITLYR